jgi:putative ABC transport system permease protein
MIDLSLSDLLLVYGLILFSFVLMRLNRVGGEVDLFKASLRMVVQLMAAGYLLHLLFNLRQPLLIVLVLLVMLFFAVITVGGRVKQRLPQFYRVVGSAMLIGCGSGTFYLVYLVLGLSPWYEPRYLIPLTGMILGNAMTGAALAAERLAGEMETRQDEIETLLCFGASPRQACRSAIRAAFRAALIPVINAMAAMGVVFLPGMMTGQILSGTEPMIAVKYQIAIMCVITGSVALTTSLILLRGYRGYFTTAEQLRRDLLRKTS